MKSLNGNWKRNSAAPGRVNAPVQLTKSTNTESKMAEQIVAAARETKARAGYSLPEKDRLALVGKTRFGRRSILIEQQRQDFIARYGDPFGDVVSENSW